MPDIAKLLVLSMALWAPGQLFAGGNWEPGAPIQMEDGSYVFVDEEDGTTRMVDARGKPVKMQDNVEMMTADGEVIVMRNHRVWKLVGPPGKRKTRSKVE